MRAAFLLSPSSITRGRMGASKAALILRKNSHFDRTLQHYQSKQVPQNGSIEDGGHSIRTVTGHFLLFATAYFIYDVYAMFRVHKALKGETNPRRPGFSPMIHDIASYVKDKPLLTAHHIVVALGILLLRTPLLSQDRCGHCSDFLVCLKSK